MTHKGAAEGVIAMEGDGGVVAAINSYRVDHGLKRVTGGANSSLSRCLVSDPNGPCGQRGAFGQSNDFSGSGGLNVIRTDNPKALNDPDCFRVEVGWVKVQHSDGSSFYEVAISTFINDGGWN